MTRSMPTVELVSADGARATIHEYGAHVVSWIPPDGAERLFLSSRSAFVPGTAIRGGIPVIFPQFATEGPLPRHGFARTSLWGLDEVTRLANGDAQATLSLFDDAVTRAMWNARFVAKLIVRVGGAELEVALQVENFGDVSVSFTAALHTYLRLRDVRAASVDGLHGVSYRESSAPGTMRRDDAATLTVSGAIDRVYADVPGPLLVREPHHELRVEQRGFRDVIVWNPGPAAAAKLPDLAPDEWREMLCVEAGAVQQPIQLDPGGGWWRGSQTLTALPVTPSPSPFDEAAAVERAGFAARLGELEAFVARAGADGEELPPQVGEMIARLREIVTALDALTSSMKEPE